MSKPRPIFSEGTLSAERRALVAETAFDTATAALAETLSDFRDNSGLDGELDALRATLRDYDTIAAELDEARAALKEI